MMKQNLWEWTQPAEVASSANWYVYPTEKEYTSD